MHDSARPSLTYIFLNNEVPPLNNVDVRKAINYAINRTAILAQWGGPLAGAPSDQIIPAGQSDYKQFNIYPNTPDLAKAKELMKAAHVKLPVTLALRTQNDTPGFINMAQVIQANLKPIGINVQIVGTPNSVNGSFISQPQGAGADGHRTLVARLPRRRGDHQHRARPGQPERRRRTWPDGATRRSSRPSTMCLALQGSARQTAYESLDQQIMSEQAPYAPLFNPKWYDFVSERARRLCLQRGDGRNKLQHALH